MDTQEFHRRLSELAEIKKIKLANRPIRSRNDEEPIEIKTPNLSVTLTATDNPTLGVEIKKVKNQIHKCDGCGDMVQGRIVERKLYEFPVMHWRDNCKKCNKSYNPQTDQFDLDTKTAQWHIGNILKTTNFMVKKSKPAK